MAWLGVYLLSLMPAPENVPCSGQQSSTGIFFNGSSALLNYIEPLAQRAITSPPKPSRLSFAGLHSCAFFFGRAQES